ncbi:MAG: PD40 domain-containing protein [Anaerolineae bacterium]|nr:PD40 domain-containing protein [Anaerolineae bacterium]
MLHRIKRSVLIVILFILVVFPAKAFGQTTPPSERIALAAYRNGQWDIYSIAPAGNEPRQLTNDIFEDTDPAYSPDGSKLAFVSRRHNNWDVYILNLQTGEETRLTNSPHYDGAPSWSPGGERLAYESYQNGNLDIWLIDAAGDGPADGGPATNLTAASTAGDFAPAWSPDGETIAFTSWREGSKDLYLLNVSNGEVTRLTNTPTAEERPVWHPAGRKLAYVIDDLGDQEVFILDPSNPPAAGGPVEPVTWLGRTDGPAWNPVGDSLAAVFHRWDGEIISVETSDSTHQLPWLLTDVISVQGRLTWHSQAVEFGQAITSLVDPGRSGLYQEVVTKNDDSNHEPYNLVRLDDLDVGTPWLADTVDDSFQAWRFRLQDEVGYDFLGTLSDASRDVATYNETSQYASWHKSGRAVDTLFDYHINGQLAHEIGREDYSGETYWRVFLRCVDQSGRCGRPLVVNPWNYSSRARTEIAPEQGGIEKVNLSGYYVDLTALAREYGWERISSHDDEEYSWTWHFLAFEYWHYQKRLANGVKNGANSSVTNWYQAMLDVYPQETLDRYFTWQKMSSLNENPHLIALKGVPLPLQIKPWWAVVEQP